MQRLFRTIATSTIVLWAAAALAVDATGSTDAPVTPAAPAPMPPAPTPPASAPPQGTGPAPGQGTPATVLDTQDYETLLGKSVRAMNGDDLGRIIDIVVDKDGRPRAAIIDFGGFLGVGSRKIAVEWRALKFNADGKVGRLTLGLNRNQVRVSPEYKAGEPVVVLGPSSPGSGPEGDQAQAPPAVAPAAAPAAAPPAPPLPTAVQAPAAPAVAVPVPASPSQEKTPEK